MHLGKGFEGVHVMKNETVEKQTGVVKPPVAPESVGEHKCGDVDTLPPTPERKAKTGDKPPKTNISTGPTFPGPINFK
jgi:hypothetical protein